MVRWPLPVVTVLVLGSLLLTTACSPQETSKSPTTSSAVDGGTEGVDPEISALVGELASMEQAPLQAEMAANAAFLERQLMMMSGMQEELGGAPAADKAYAQLVMAVQGALPAGGTPSSGRFGAIVRSTDPGGVGAAFAAGGTLTMIAAPAAIQQGSQVKPGDDPVVNRNEAGPASTTTTSTTTTAAVTTKMSVAGGGLSVDATSAMDSQVCPSPSGDATIDGTIDTRLGVGAGVTGTTMKIDYSIVAHVGDDAIITGRDTTYRIQLASFDNKKGKYVDLTLKAAFAGKALQGVTATIPRQAGPVDQKFINSAVSLVMSQVALIEMTVIPALQEAIESGRCVEVAVAVTPQPQEGTQPSTPFTIVASPTSRVDGQPAGGTVLATMKDTNGSVDPANVKVPANATFAYVAPTEKERSSTVLLEARSKRGVGKGTAFFSTYVKGWRVDAPWGVFELRGPICNPAEPFSLTAASPDGDLELDFTPTDQSSGSLTMNGTYSESTITGAGTYTLVLDESGGSLKMKTAGEGTISGFTVPSFVGTYEIPITATDFC